MQLVHVHAILPMQKCSQLFWSKMLFLLFFPCAFTTICKMKRQDRMLCLTPGVEASVVLKLCCFTDDTLKQCINLHDQLIF